MLRDLFFSLLSTFVIEPYLAEINAQLDGATAPAIVAEQLQSCAEIVGPILAERASGDLWWGTTTVVGVAIGMTDPKTVIAEADPLCATAIETVRPYLESTGA